MKKSIIMAIAGLLAVPVLALSTMVLSPVVSQVGAEGVCENGKTMEDALDCNDTDNPTCLFGGEGCVFTIIVNTALYVIGALSVLMLIYGGIRYTISMGDEKNVVAAKNTIMYAVVGIVVALMAYAIVNFVLGQFISK